MFITERLISIVAPHRCLVCGNEGSLLCNWCKPDALAPLPERCYRCKKLSLNSAICPSCRKISKLKHVWVRSDYSEVAKLLVHELKFQRAQAAAACIAELIDEAVPWLPEDTLVVHVPTASMRRRMRGYDQAELITKAFAQQRGLPSIPLLGRLGQSRQVGSKRAQRQQQLQDAFWPRKPYLIKGAHIILVDDIVTTGATLETAAAVLKQAGAKSIQAVVFAQKQ